MVWRPAALLLVLALAACGTEQPRPATVVAAPPPEPIAVWRSTIAPGDLPRLETLPGALTDLRPKLPPASRRLADPAAALDHVALSPGSYRCRAAAVRGPDFCYISVTPDGLALVKQTGSRAIAGYLHVDADRYVFLGATQRRAGDNALGYGTDPARSLVGTVERIGAFRWRLAIAGAGLPKPLLYELTPVPAELQPKG